MKTHLYTLFAAAATVTILALPLARAAEEKIEKKPATDEPAKPAKPYPLDTCVVSGEKLGEMGKPHVFTHDGREVKLCCKSCLKDFNKDPAKYLKKLDEK